MQEIYKYSYKMTGNQLSSLSVYNVGHQKCAPGYQWGPGVRDHYCIHYVVSGTGYYSVGGVKHTLTAGDCFILYPNMELTYYADKKHPWEYAWVGFTGGDAESIIQCTDFSREHPYIRGRKLPAEKVRSSLGQIYDQKGNSYRAAVEMTGALYTLLAVFMEHSQKGAQEQESRDSYVEKAEHYIAANYSYPITVEDVAAYAGISRSYLFRAFRVYRNQSPKEYLTEFRIKQACHLLQESGLSVTAISYSVGFEDNLYFSKAFKRRMGVSPTQFRRQKQFLPH